MNFGPIQFLMTLGILVLIVGVLVVVGWWFVHDKPIDSHRFSWHQLVKDSFHVSVIDRLGKEHIADIHYNVNAKEPKYKTSSDRRLQVYLPVGFTREQFFEFITSIEHTDGHLSNIIMGIRQEKVLTEFHFSHNDISIYRDFKRHLLLKALKG